MKLGCLACGVRILYGGSERGVVFGSGIPSTSFILRRLMASGVSPDCLMIAKNAFSLIGACSVILLMSSFSMVVLLMKMASPNSIIPYRKGRNNSI